MYYFPDKKADESASNSLNPSIVEGLVPLCAPDADCHGQSYSACIWSHPRGAFFVCQES